MIRSKSVLGYDNAYYLLIAGVLCFSCSCAYSAVHVPSGDVHTNITKEKLCTIIASFKYLLADLLFANTNKKSFSFFNF